MDKVSNILQYRESTYSLFLAVLSLLLAGIIGALIVIGSYFLPTNTMQNNVRQSLKIYDVEKDRYSWAPSVISSQMDNWTDSIMINIAAFDKGDSVKNIIENAMMNPQYAVSNVDYKSDNLKYAYELEVDRSKISQYNYGRYWHGYVVLLKPLLMFFTISDVRLINMILQTLLLIVLMFELYKKGGNKLALPFLLAILIFNPISCALCMQFACIYYITMISIIIFLKNRLYASSFYWLFFLWIGIITSFFDFLTYPLVTLGCNLILLILLNACQLFDKMKKVIIASVSWSVGYAVMWSEKWLIGYLLTGNNIISDAINSFKIRTAGNVSYSDNSMLSAVLKNLKAFDNHIFYTLLILGIVAMIIYYLLGKYKVKINSSIVIPLCIVFVYPFTWLIVMKNHSFIHYWMTHKIFMISVLAFVYSIIYSVESISQKEQVNNFKVCIKKIAVIIAMIIVSYIIASFLPSIARVDIFSAYSDNPVFDVKISENNNHPSEAIWMQKSGNRGFVIQKNGYRSSYIISVTDNTDINIVLRGPDVRDANGKRIEKWVRYTDFRINGEKIISEPVDVWHDKPFRYILKAKKNQTYKIQLKWRKK